MIYIEQYEDKKHSMIFYRKNIKSYKSYIKLWKRIYSYSVCGSSMYYLNRYLHISRVG
jgi:hypothetical protein